MIYTTLKRVLIGNPLSTAAAKYERLAKIPALAIFASDMMSSVAYATEEILLVLVLGGTLALQYSPHVGIAIGTAGRDRGHLLLADHPRLSLGRAAPTSSPRTIWEPCRAWWPARPCSWTTSSPSP